MITGQPSLRIRVQPLRLDFTQAECRHYPPEIWFPDRNDDTTWRVAKQICGDCRIQELCLAEALAVEASMPDTARWGVYGGKTPKERSKIIRRAA